MKLSRVDNPFLSLMLLCNTGLVTEMSGMGLPALSHSGFDSQELTYSMPSDMILYGLRNQPTVVVNYMISSWIMAPQGFPSLLHQLAHCTQDVSLHPGGAHNIPPGQQVPPASASFTSRFPSLEIDPMDTTVNRITEAMSNNFFIGIFNLSVRKNE